MFDNHCTLCAATANCCLDSRRLHAYLRELVSVMSTSGALRFGRSVATGDWNAVIDEVAREVT
jgi:hypothetical protein